MLLLFFVFVVIVVVSVVIVIISSFNCGWRKQQLIFSAGTAARVFSDIADYNRTLSTIKASYEAFGLSATKYIQANYLPRPATRFLVSVPSYYLQANYL